MPNAEKWPTEAAATAAVEAAARSFYDSLRPATVPTEYHVWDKADPVTKTRCREAVLPTVWAALEALPDPRGAAWHEGFGAAKGGATRYDSPYGSGL